MLRHIDIAIKPRSVGIYAKAYLCAQSLRHASSDMWLRPRLAAAVMVAGPPLQWQAASRYTQQSAQKLSSLVTQLGDGALT